MKKRFLPVFAILLGSFALSSCMGSFVISKKLYNWNQSATGNRFVDNLLFWVLSPVYSFTLGVDAVILNLVEFWSGSNPLAFAPNFEGTDRLAYGGRVYELERTKTSFTIRELGGATQLQMVLNHNQVWCLVQDERQLPMFSMEGETVHFYHDNQVVSMQQAAVPAANPLQVNVSAWALR